MRFFANGFFSEFIYTLYFEYYFYFTLFLRNYYGQFGQIIFFFIIINLNFKTNGMFLFNNQIISGDYSKTPFLVRSEFLFTEIMPRASIRQGLLFRGYKLKLIRSVNAENVERQTSRASAS